ncbi:MAG: transcription elongation factor GreA [Candidatus Liptonbacteria bacterium RIFCSPLOWO2_01_FULL_52_25]|uniref:Transcription elongation factor GreA n=1 Tax=Candidatus Liptonbacteria bacterium RIFCSPLOWO2_01_FULL_52_25 TaxID=1798650 RepID=A0A1G2CCW6_9BACT|nr:MAG: transcription elongation factor GreA [Candidatus Liptonbacteria bacterium RIFCSPLOWO2_01_FULL_52_25]
MDKYYLSKERLEELKQELETLKKTRRVEVADRLKRAKEYGDLSENAEYAEAREEQATVETRIFELDELVKKAVIIKKAEGGDTVRVGSAVTAKKDDKTVTYTIVGSYEAKPEEGKISDESPLGRAFMKHKVGDDVTVETPAGTVAYVVTKIE